VKRLLSFVLSTAALAASIAAVAAAQPVPLVIHGDNIPAHAVDLPAQDSWRARLQMARLWRDAVNKHGGDVTVLHLPQSGIMGNTHFPMSD
jgi:hypothetical protein